MHIAEGVASPLLLLAGAGVSLVGVGVGLRALDAERLPRVAVLTSCFFVISAVHVPLGPIAVHLTLVGLMGLLLGVAAFPAIAVALLLQAIWLKEGGLTSWPLNTAIQGGGAWLVYWLSRPWLTEGWLEPGRLWWLGFAGGAGGLLAAGLLQAVVLIAGGSQWSVLAAGSLLVHGLLSVVEGFLSATILVFLATVRSDLLPWPRRRSLRMAWVESEQARCGR